MKATFPKPFKQLHQLPTPDQAFKYMSQQGLFSFKNHNVSMLIDYSCFYCTKYYFYLIFYLTPYMNLFK